MVKQFELGSAELALESKKGLIQVSNNNPVIFDNWLSYFYWRERKLFLLLVSVENED